MNRFIFALHRGGSSVLGVIAKNCGMASGEPAVILGSAPQSFHETGADGAAIRIKSAKRRAPDGDLMEAEFEPQIENWQKHTGVFAPIRRADFFPPAFFQPGDLAILNMRDPRDCMVSGYFGFLRLHGGGLDDKRRREQYDQGVDTYVVEHLLDQYVVATQRYIDLIAELPGLKVLKYEDMVTDFPSWFEAFYNHLQFNESRYSDLLPRQAAKFAPPTVEDVDAHKRQMLPGDYLRKLKPETISLLNERMAPQLSFFGYA